VLFYEKDFDLLPIVEFLRTCSFFKSFDTETDLKMLFSIAKMVVVKEYFDGDNIFHEDDDGW
jgi:hypothetical protein